MKKIEAIIHPSKIEEVKHALTQIGIQRMRISRIDEFGSQEAHKEFYRGRTYMVDVVKEFKIELMVATDEMLSQVIETIEKYNHTETAGDGEIFISPVEKVTPFQRKGNGTTGSLKTAVFLESGMAQGRGHEDQHGISQKNILKSVKHRSSTIRLHNNPSYEEVDNHVKNNALDGHYRISPGCFRSLGYCRGTTTPPTCCFGTCVSVAQAGSEWDRNG